MNYDFVKKLQSAKVPLAISVNDPKCASNFSIKEFFLIISCKSVESTRSPTNSSVFNSVDESVNNFPSNSSSFNGFLSF